MGKNKKSIYVVVHGHQPGIYYKWFGNGGALEQIDNFSNAIYKGFYSKEEAARWLKELDTQSLPNFVPALFDLVVDESSVSLSKNVNDDLEMGKVVIFTDGSSIGNPGSGGYGVVLRYGKYRKEISGGYRETTNNRMEIMACIVGLQALKRISQAVIYSDSRYVVNSMAKGWAKRWRANGWMRKKKHKAENVDLWVRLLELCDEHNVEFRWVRGHAGNLENERCDQLAQAAAKQEDLPVDEGFETDETNSLLSLFGVSDKE